MKKFLIPILFLCIAPLTASVNEDLKIIVEKVFLEPQCEPLLNMVAMEAITESKKQIDAEKLIEKFRQSFTDQKTLAKFFEPYKAMFSEEELSELRKIHENPVWLKYSREGMPLAQAQLQVMRETFKDLASSVVSEVKQAIAESNILEVTQENFEEIGESEKPVILDVGASWCNPCRMMEPILEELSDKYKDTIQFAKLDFDSQSELAKQLDVTVLPTILFIKPGESAPVMKNVGFLSKKDLEAKIADFLKE